MNVDLLRKVFDDIPQEIKSMKQISLILYGTSTVKLGYLIFAYPVAVPKYYLLFRRVNKDSQYDKHVIFLGEYQSLKNAVYWLKKDVYTRSQTIGSAANGCWITCAECANTECSKRGTIAEAEVTK